MLNLIRAAIASVLLLITLPAAEAQNGFYVFVLSKGNSGCGDFLQAMDGERNAHPKKPVPPVPGYTIFYSEEYQAFAMFADGFLTGVNYATARYKGAGGREGATTDQWGRALWLENYCRQQPLSSYINALLALRGFLETQDAR
jgi:hypothetical protein